MLYLWVSDIVGTGSDLERKLLIGAHERALACCNGITLQCTWMPSHALEVIASL